MARPRSVVGPETPAGRPAGPVRGADPTGTIRPAAAAPLIPRAVRLRLQRLEPIRALDGLALVPGPDADAAPPDADPQDFAQFDGNGESGGGQDAGTFDADPAATDGAVRIDAGADAGDGVADRFEVSEIDGRLVVSVNGRVAYSGDAADSHTLHFAGSADADQLFLDPNLFQTAGGDLNLSFDGAGGADSIELGGSVGSVAHHLLGGGAGSADDGTDAADGPTANSVAADGLNLSHAGVEQVADRFDAAARTLTVDGAAELHGTGTAGVFTDGVTTVTFAADAADLDVQADALTITGALDLAGGEGAFRATDSLSLETDAALTSAGGALTLDGGASLVVSGTVDVSNAEGRGGTATLLGGEITLTDTAVVDASGATGGGEILVGGGARGENPALPNAEFTTIAEGARLDASATVAGDGGTVIVWANDTTRFAGSISARGAGAGGDGGFAEVSGKAHVQVSGHADLRSAGGPDGGAYGTFLIDPGSVEVVDGPNVDAGLDTFNDAWVAAQLESGNLTIETASGTNGQPEVITVQAGVVIEWAAATAFTLLAGRSIVVSSGAQIVATGDGSISLRANENGAQSAGANFAGVAIDGATLRTEGAGGVTIEGTGGDLSSDNSGVSVTNGGVVEATGTGAVSVTGTGGDGVSNNFGVRIQGTNSAIRSAAGAVTVVGFGGDGLFGANHGVLVTLGGAIGDDGTGTYAGAVSVTGTGGDGVSDNHGVTVAANSAIRSAGGGVTVEGTGGDGTGDANDGVSVVSAGTIEDTAAGAVSITGVARGAGAASGVRLDYFGAPGTAVSGAGVTIDGTGVGGAADIFLAGGAGVVSTTLAPITLDGATVRIESAAEVGLRLGDDSAAPPLAGTDYSQVVLTGALTLSGGVLDLTELGSAAALQGDVHVLIDNDGIDALVGEFSNLADGDILAFGAQRFQADYQGGDGNDLTLTALDAVPVTIDGTADADAFSVALDGTELVVTRSTDGGPVVEVLRGDAAALTAGGLVLNGLDGNDTLTVDYAGGFFTTPIEWNGGTQTVGVGDDLVLTGGGAFASVVHTFVNANDGSVAVFDGVGTHSIQYVGLEPVLDNLNVADRQFVFTGGAETITLSDDAAAGYMTIDSTLGESVTFLNPTASLTIDAGTGDDSVVVASVDAAYAAALSILGGDGVDTVNLAANLTLGSATSTGNLLIDVEAVSLDGAITIDTTAGTDANGDGVFRSVTVTGALDADDAANARALTISSGSGAVALGDVGAIQALGAVTINDTAGSGAITLGRVGTNAAVGADSLAVGNNATAAINFLGADYATTGSQNYLAAAGANFHIDAGVLTTFRNTGTAGADVIQFDGFFGNTSLRLADGSDLVIQTAGGAGDAITVNGISGVDAAADETVTLSAARSNIFGDVLNVRSFAVTAGVAQLSGDITTSSQTTDNGVAFQGVLLTGPARTIDVSAGNGNVVFNSVVQASGATSADLVIDAGTGTVTANEIGSGATAFNDVTVTAATFHLRDRIVTRAIGADAGDVQINADFVLTGNVTVDTTTDDGANDADGSVTVTGSVTDAAGNRSLTINAGTAAVAVESLTVGGNLTVTGAVQTYGGTLGLGGTGTLTGTDATFNGRVVGYSAGAEADGVGALTVTAGGATTFNDLVGRNAANTADVRLASLTTDGGGTTRLNEAGGGSSATPAVATTGTVQFDDDVVLGTDLAITVGGSILFGGTLESVGDAAAGMSLTIGGGETILFAGAVGATNRLRFIQTNTTGTTQVDTTTVRTALLQSYNNAVTFNADNAAAGTTTFTATDGAVTFENAVTGAAGDSLIVNADAAAFNGGSVDGDLTVAADVGNVAFASGTLAVTGNATVTAAGAILGGTDDGVADLTAAVIDLTANGVGSAATSLDLFAATALNVDTSTANGDMFVDGIGDLNLGAVDAGTGDVTLTATGAIVDANGAAVNVTATAADLQAGGNLGGGDAIELQVDSVTAVAGAGDLRLSDLSGGLTVTNAAATGGGSLNIVAIGGDLTVGTVAAQFNAFLGAGDGAIVDGNGAGTLNVTATFLEATAQTGVDLDFAGSTGAIQTTGTGNIALRSAGLVNVQSGGISAADGDVSLQANALRLQSGITAGGGGTATLTATQYIENLGGGVKVTADAAALIAGSFIGAGAGAPLELAVDTLAFDADGAVYLTDVSGGLTVGTVGGLTASRAGGGGAVTATDLAGDGSLTVAHAVTVGADFALTAGDDVVFDGGSVTATGGTLSVTADAEGSADGNRGSISQTGAGVVIVAPRLTLSAYDGIGDDGVTDNALRIDVGTLSATNAGAHDVRLVESDDVAVGSLVNVGRLVTLTAGGAITDGSTMSETPNITAGFVALRAGTGIGANAGAGNDDADLDLADGTVVAARVTGNGPIHLSADDGSPVTEESLTVGAVDGLTGVSVAGTGDIRLAATFDLTIDAAVSAADGSVFLAADSDGDCDGDLRINAAVTAGADGSYGFSANNVLLATNVTATGAGAIDVIACRTIVVNPGVTVSAADGDVTLLANDGGANAGNFTAVTLAGAAIRTTGTGAISVTGTGASDGTTSGNRGVLLTGGGVIAATGGGAVEVTGTGGAGVDFNYGVFVSGAGSAIASTAADGNVTVTGTGGAGSGQLNVGVLLDFDAEILAADVAAVTGFGGDGGTNAAVGVYVLRGAAISGTSAVVTGTGGDGTGAQNRGVSLALGGVIGGTTGPVTVTGTGGAGTTQNDGVHLLQDTNGDGTGAPARIHSAGGPVLVTGVGGGGTDSHGVYVGPNALIENTAAGTVTVRGDVTGATSTDGVRVVDGAIRTADGDVTLDADFLLNDNGDTTPDARGTLSVLGTGSVVAGTAAPVAGNGNVRVTAADLNLGAAASIAAAADAILLHNSTAGRTIGLGGGAGDFNLTDAEADRLTAAVLEIGNGDAAFKAGDVTAGELTLGTIADALVLRTGGSVIESGADAAADLSGVANLAIRADGRVGGATDADGDRLEVDVATLAVSAFDGAPVGGSVRLADVGGNLTVGTVADSVGALTAGLRATDEVDLLVAGSLTVQNTAGATDLGGGALAAIAGGGIAVEAGAAVATTGGHAVLKANGGALILAAGATLTTDGGDAGLEAFGALTMQEAGAVFASISTVDGAAGGTVVLRSRTGDVTLTQVSAGAGRVGVEAGGAILDGLTGDGAGATNLSGSAFAALAGTGVGTALNALDVAFDTFAAETTAGDLRIDNFGRPLGTGDVIIESVAVPDVVAVGQTVVGLAANGLQAGGTVRADAPLGNLIVNADVYGGVRAELGAGEGVRLNADVGSHPTTGSVAVLARGGDIVQPGADRITAGVVALEASGSIGVASFANPGNVGAINLNAAVVAARADGNGVGVAQRGGQTLTIGAALGMDGGVVAGVTTDSGTASVFAVGGVFVTRAVGEAVRYEIRGGTSRVTRAALVAGGDVNFAGDGRLTTRTGQAVAPLPGTLIPVTGSPPGTFRVGQTGELLSIDTGLPVDFAVEAGTRRGGIADQNLTVQLILPNGQLSPNQLPPGAGGTVYNFGPQSLPIGAELIDLANQAAANGGTLPGAFIASFDPSIRLVGVGNLATATSNLTRANAPLTFVFGDVVASDPLPDPEPEPVAPPELAPPVVAAPTFVAPPPFADLDEAAPAAGAPASDLPELQLWIYQDQQGLTEGLDEPGAPALTVPDLAYYLIGDPFRSAYLSDPYFQNLGAEGAVFQFVIVRPGQDPEVESTFRVESGGLEQPLFRRGPLPTFEDAAPTAPVGPPPAVVPSDAPASAPGADAAPDAAPEAAEGAPGEPVSALDAPQTEAGFDLENLELDEAAALVAAAAGGVPGPSRASARWRRRRDAVVREMLARDPARSGRAGQERVGQERDRRLPVVPAGGGGTAPGSADADGEKLANGSAPGTLDAPAPGFPELGSTGLGRSARRARRLAAVR
ncbi:hypothetical protein [Alienimonas californiensis]|uniref:Uncharacterized protein n=1 Tax=Alienimonas californiensis TaxID=2527989 RepID=A0A517P6U7_9PLAN|nr:hypothetical protein [Alienimonas californiensis]QDT15095.1 hypothetical protein CA12_11760 [Alienimonas californiensis]